MKRLFLLATLMGVVACGLFFFTATDASAHGAQVVRGSRLETIHERRSCEHIVEFFVRGVRYSRYMEVYGPERTHPVIIAKRGDVVVAKYWTPGNQCHPDYRHRPWQFTLRVF